MTRDGFSVSYDIDTLREGRFDKRLLERIEQCVDFIPIVAYCPYCGNPTPPDAVFCPKCGKKI